MKPKLSKEHRLADVVDKGQRVAAFLADPVIANFLGDLETGALNEVLSATRHGTADEICRAALNLNTLRDLRHYLRQCSADGERVMKQLSET